MLIRAKCLNKKLFLLIVIFLFSSLVEIENLTGQPETTNFSIVVIGDTQYYSEQYPHIFTNQTQWIADNVVHLNLVFVPHLGDLVQNGDSHSEWETATESMNLLDNRGISWTVIPGNHEFWGDGNLTNYNAYFGVGNFSGKSWFGGSYPPGTNNNNFALFSGGGNDYLIFSFQYHLSDSVLVWANETIAQYPDRRVIVASHEYLYANGMRNSEGRRMWDTFVVPHADQVFLVLCGHLDGEAHLTSDVNGNKVHQLLSCYSGRENGGNGWLRILEFHPEEAEILVKTFSPYLNLYENDDNSQFSLHYNQTPLVIPTPTAMSTYSPSPSPSPNSSQTVTFSPSPNQFPSPTETPSASPEPTIAPTQSPDPQPDPFPTIMVIVSVSMVAIVCIGLFVYPKKLRK